MPAMRRKERSGPGMATVIASEGGAAPCCDDEASECIAPHKNAATRAEIRKEDFIAAAVFDASSVTTRHPYRASSEEQPRTFLRRISLGARLPRPVPQCG